MERKFRPQKKSKPKGKSDKSATRAALGKTLSHKSPRFRRVAHSGCFSGCARDFERAPGVRILTHFSTTTNPRLSLSYDNPLLHIHPLCFFFFFYFGSYHGILKLQGSKKVEEIPAKYFTVGL